VNDGVSEGLLHVKLPVSALQTEHRCCMWK